MNEKIVIVVATHKKYDMPKDKMYFPLHVGAEGKKDKHGKALELGYPKDNEGDNISYKNPCFGSQTGLYWAWKHIDADYIGLVHYRRYFLGKKKNKENVMESILTEEQLRPMLSEYKVFVPKKRRYYIETIYSTYVHAMNGGKEEFDTTREIIRKKCPEYIHAFDKVMHRRWGYMFNMMIMEKELLDSYCNWLFAILFELENRIDTTGWSDFDKRFCGRVSERLFDVWLERQVECEIINKNEIKELPYMESVNWPDKIASFLMAKIFHKKYRKSF
ncbi:MAG: DUF4422 domain-containing protein [Clostridiales bacterium]|nr:DUF4422 domain-containing protein [Clostridiales bacterium]